MKQLAVVGGVWLFFLMVPLAQASSLYMDPATATINQGDILKIAVRLNTDSGECINTIDAVIHYTGNIEPIDISRGESIMSMWVEVPTINKDAHTITFAGGIPNGYCGRIAGDPRLTNVVADLLFQSPGFVIGAKSDATNTAVISFDPKTQVLLNDGLGTRASTTFAGASVVLTNKSTGNLQNDWESIVSNDKIPPEQFSIDLEHTPNAFSNDYFITFNTTDKQSGIDHYEVMEEPLSQSNLFNWGAATAPWVTARSPYVLKDQSLNSTIRVRAIDKAGNIYVATLVPDQSQRGMSTKTKVYLAVAVVGGTLLFVVIILGFVWWRRRKSRSTIVVQSNLDRDMTDNDIENFEHEADPVVAVKKRSKK